jgi:hypothetical protein
MNQPHTYPDYLTRDVLHPDDYALVWPVVARLPDSLRADLLEQHPNDPRLKNAYAGALALQLTRLIVALPNPLPPSLVTLQRWADEKAATKQYDEFVGTAAELVARVRATDERYAYWGISAMELSAIGRVQREQRTADGMKQLLSAAAQSAEAARRSSELADELRELGKRGQRRAAIAAWIAALAAIAAAALAVWMRFQPR